MMTSDVSASSSPSRNMDVFGKELRLSESDRKLLPGVGEIFLCKSLQVETHSKKGDISEPRSLVISSTRCYILLPSSKLETSFNFLTIQQLQCSEQKLTFHLTGESRPREFLSSRLDSVEVISLITSQLKNVFPRTSLEVLLKLTFDPDSLRNDVARLRNDLMSTMDRMDPSSVQSLITSYGFLCDFFGTEYKSEVSWYLNNVYLGHGLREIKLSDFDHLTTKELLPLISSLRHNDFFEGIIDRDGKLAAEVLEELCHAMNSSPSIKTLVLSNCGLKSESVSRLASSLKNNPRVSLTHLNLSETLMDEKAVEGLGAALESLPHGLHQLRLANCKISSKGASLLAHSMKQNKQMQYSLVDFDLSSNPLGPDPQGSLSFLQEPHTISTLNLSNCSLLLETVVPILIRGCTQHLSHLNLARNTGKGKKLVHGPAVASGFQQFCSSSISIRSLNLAGCKLVNTIVTSMLEGLGSNPNISSSSLHLDISSNDLGSNGVQQMIAVLGRTECLHQLNLSECGLDQNMSDLITSISEGNNKLKHLMVGKNFGGKSVTRSMVVSQLASLLKKEDCRLHSLCLDDSNLKEHTPIILEALADNTSLEKINISGNHMGSRGARCLAKALLCNCSLVEVCWDRNDTPLRGFQEIAASLEHNFTLRVMPLPLYDMGRAGKGVEDSMQTIQRHLCRNHSDERLKVEIAARHRTRLLTATQQSSVVGRELVQLEDLLQWTRTNHPSHELVVEGGAVKELANSAIKLTDGLYSPRVEADQFQIINTQVKKLLEEFMEHLFLEHIKERSVNMINKSISVCNTLLSEETKEKLLNLSVTEKTREFSQAKRDVLRHALPEIVNHVSDSNVEVAANISELVVEHTLTTLEKINHKLLKLQKDERAKSRTTPDTKVSRNFTFRVQEDSSPTKRKKRVRREDKEDEDDFDGNEIDLPIRPLESSGPVLQHLGKSRPKPARLQRGRPSKKLTPQGQTESITSPPSDLPSTSTPPLQPKTPPLQPKTPPLQPKTPPLQPKTPPLQPMTPPLQPKTPPPQPKVAMKPLMGRNKKQEKEETTSEEQSKNEKLLGSDDQDRSKDTQTVEDKMEEKSVEEEEEGVKEHSSTEEVTISNSTEEVDGGSTEGVKDEKEIKEEEPSGGGAERVNVVDGVADESVLSEGQEDEEEEDDEEEEHRLMIQEVQNISVDDVKGLDAVVMALSPEEPRSDGGVTPPPEKPHSNENVTPSESPREALPPGKPHSDEGVAPPLEKPHSDEGVAPPLEKPRSDEGVAPPPEKPHSDEGAAPPPKKPHSDEGVGITEKMDKNDIVSNLQDVLMKKHVISEATPPTDKAAPPIASTEASHKPMDDEESDVKRNSIKSKGSKKKSVLPNIFKRNKDVDTPPSESRDTLSGDWEVIDPPVVAADSKSPVVMPEITKKAPPAVKGKPKVKAPAPSSSDNSSSDSAGGESKKVPLVLPSAPMNSLASVLQQGAVKREGGGGEVDPSPRPSKTSPSPAPKPRPSGGDKVGPSPPPKAKSANETSTREQPHPQKMSPNPAPKPKPKPSVRRKIDGSEATTKSEEASVKNEV